MVMDEDRLIEKLRSIEALHAGARTPGERHAATCARERILSRLREKERADPPVEYRFSLADAWTRRLFVSLLRRYGVEPYRYPRQRRTTVMARVPETFVDEVIWPQFEELSATLRQYLDDITDRVIQESFETKPREASIRPPPVPGGAAPGLRED